MNTIRSFFREKGFFIGLAVVITAISFLILPPKDVCEANSAAPPSIIIMVSYAPDDLEIFLVELDRYISRTDKAYESYFTAYWSRFQRGQYTIRVTSESEAIDLTIVFQADKFQNAYTLNLDKGELKEGFPVSRSIFLIGLRLGLTLLLEGLVFLGFGYREKRSWIAFLGINLFTQGILNVWIDQGNSPVNNGYIIFALVFWEFIIILGELILFAIIVDEKSRWLTSGYVILANILSLVVGGFLITVLPI